VQPERVLEFRVRLLEGVAAAGQALEHVAAAPAVQRRPALAEPADPLDDRRRAERKPSLALEDELDRHVVAFEVLAMADRPVEPKRPVGEPDPDPSDGDDEHEPNRDGIERPRAERARDQVGGDPEAEDETASAGHTGTGVCSSASWTSARAFATRSSAIPARGLAPR
jgi:hypothetical protein